MIKKTIPLCGYLCIFFAIIGCSEDESIPGPNPEPEPEVILEPIDDFLKQYTSKDSIFILNSMVQLSDSSYTISGAVRYDETGNKNVLMNFNKYGKRTWLTVMEDTHTPYGIQKLYKNSFGYVGHVGHHYNFEDSPHIIYFDGNGNVEKEILTNNSILGHDVVRDGNNFLIAGYGDGDMLLRMITQDGNLIWNKSFQFYPDAHSLDKLDDGNFIVIGGGGYTGVGEYLLKVDNKGEVIWSKPYKGLEVTALPNNEFLAVTTGDSSSLVRFDELGTKVWDIPLQDLSLANLGDALTIINYDDFVVTAYVNNKYNLNILVSDLDGNVIKLHTIDSLRGGKYTLVSKTLDGGLLISYSDTYFGHYLMKMSEESILN